MLLVQKNAVCGLDNYQYIDEIDFVFFPLTLSPSSCLFYFKFSLLTIDVSAHLNFIWINLFVELTLYTTNKGAAGSFRDVIV